MHVYCLPTLEKRKGLFHLLLNTYKYFTIYQDNSLYPTIGNVENCSPLQPKVKAPCEIKIVKTT